MRVTRKNKGTDATKAHCLKMRRAKAQKLIDILIELEAPMADIQAAEASLAAM